MKFLKSGIIHRFAILSLRPNLDERQKGFTLLELIVVMIIISILFAVAIPTFFSQVGKARESELLLKLGAMARSQQGYHYEKGRFAPSINALENNDGGISSFYYNFLVPDVTTTRVKHQAVAKDSGKDQTRDYAIGVYFENGAYGRATCQGANIGDAVNVGELSSDPCTNSGTKVK